VPVLNEKPKFWRFIQNSGGTQQEELVLRMQGVITQKDLPPLLKRYVSSYPDWCLDPIDSLAAVRTTNSKDLLDRTYELPDSTRTASGPAWNRFNA
jgi:hypothetical protein